MVLTWQSTEPTMNIIYAAEKPTIAGMLSSHLGSTVREDDVYVHRNPAETGSFLVSFRTARFRLTPGGRLVPVGRLRRA